MSVNGAINSSFYLLGIQLITGMELRRRVVSDKEDMTTAVPHEFNCLRREVALLVIILKRENKVRTGN